MKKIFSLLYCAILFCTVPHYLCAQQAKVEIVAFYNLENLFDTIDAPGVIDEEFLPNGLYKWDSLKYTQKIANMAKVISMIGTDISPDGASILGVSEIENRGVLEDIIKQPCLKDRNYKIVHFDSPDKRGIDVGLLYQPKYFTVTAAESIPVLIYRDDKSRIFTRDILHVTGTMDGEEVHVLVNHWPSRRGGQASSAPLRNVAADTARKLFDSLALINPNVNFIMMGDLNDDPIDASIKNHLRAHSNAQKVKPGNLFGPMINMYKAGEGTLAYNDTWSLFDQIILSYGLLHDDDKGFKFLKSYIFKKRFMIQKDGNFVGYPLRTFDNTVFMNGFSDHFPVYIVLTKKI